MRFARPPEGFHIKLSSRAEEQYSRALQAHPVVLPAHWTDLRNRIKISGHKEGVLLNELPGENGYALLAEPKDFPKIQIVFTIRGDTLTIQSMRLIERDAD